MTLNRDTKDERGPLLSEPLWTEFLASQRLPSAYAVSAEQWFTPLVAEIIRRSKAQAAPLFLAVNGSQGSGKSTLGALLEFVLPRTAGLSVACVSLDDFYLTRAEREALGAEIHPLLQTRGVPGTHDVALMTDTLSALLGDTDSAGKESAVTLSGTQIAIPSFDKATDDRTDMERWHQVGAPVDVVIWEGWCLGAAPQGEHRLDAAVNALEREQDVDGRWRRYVDAALSHYQPLFDRADLWVMLAAPSFDCVCRWRCEQEEKLAQTQAGGDRSGIMSASEIEEFIQFYQRLTEWSLATVPARCHFLYELDEFRKVRSLAHPIPLESS